MIHQQPLRYSGGVRGAIAKYFKMKDDSRESYAHEFVSCALRLLEHDTTNNESESLGALRTSWYAFISWT